MAVKMLSGGPFLTISIDCVTNAAGAALVPPEANNFMGLWNQIHKEIMLHA